MSETSETSETSRMQPGAAGEMAEDGWEWWAKLSVILVVSMALAWLAVLLRLGTISVYVHGAVIPMLGVLTVPLMFWGLLRALFRPPVIRRSRGIGFLLLLVVGVLGNVPLIAPPLSTEDWTAEQKYRLPFEGQWYVTAGGDDMDRNYHATTAAFRWAYDFTAMEEGEKFRGDGLRNHDYFCWERPVLAPASGEVVGYANDVEDNTPGQVPTEGIFGNHVVLRAGEDEYVFVAHMKQGSVSVRPGDQVEAGQVVGACGNSGRSVEPHVHVHAQTTPEFPWAEGLPVRFDRYRVDGQVVEDGMPVGPSSWQTGDGQLVEPVR